MKTKLIVTLAVIIIIPLAGFVLITLGGRWIPPKLSSDAKLKCNAAAGEIILERQCGTSLELIQDEFSGGCKPKGLVGPGGCAPRHSHYSYSCRCPKEKCWDGNNCIEPPKGFE